MRIALKNLVHCNGVEFLSLRNIENIYQIDILESVLILILNYYGDNPILDYYGDNELWR